MMPRKKRITVIIIGIVAIILLITTLFILLYNNTDMFRSNQTLFLKYIGKNSENINEIQKIWEKTEFDNLLETSLYTENLELKVNYTKNIGTTAENTTNSINQLKVLVEGQADRRNQYEYKNVKLLKDDSTISQIELIQNSNSYGIRFSDLFKQYILVENSNLKDLFKKLGYTDEQVASVPDNIEIDQDILDIFRFNKEELEILNKKYTTILSQEFSKDKFEKQKNQTITIDQKDLITNAYILNMTKEQFNNMYIKVLENLKEDEIILKKIEKLQKMIDQTKLISLDNINLKEIITTKIEKKIEEINKNNIGNEQTKIIVYEINGKTVRTTIKGVDYQIDYDYLQKEEEKLVEVSFKEGEVETQKFTLRNKEKEVEIEVENNKEDKPNKIIFKTNRKENDKNLAKNIQIKYEDDNNRVETTVMQNINIVDNFQEKVMLNSENSIQLNGLTAEQMQGVVNRVNEAVNTNLQQIKQKIEIEQIQEILKDLGIVKEKQELQETGTSELERNQFNSKFEILQGENIDSENILKVLETIKGNLINIEVVSNQELKIEVDQNNSNEELVNSLKSFFEKDKNLKYNINLENDQQTGLVKYLVITIVTES